MHLIDQIYSKADDGAGYAIAEDVEREDMYVVTIVSGINLVIGY